MCLVPERVLVSVRVILDLVAEDLGVPRCLLDEGGGEVAHPDMQHTALFLQFAHGSEGLAERYAVARPVHQKQVDVVGAELLEALAGLPDHAFVGEVARPDLGGNEDLTPVYAGTLDAPSHLSLVAVHLGRIKVPVSEREPALDGPLAPLSRKPVGAKPEGGKPLALYRL